ncbi:MAG TPA: hypothetical protein DEB06_07030 [Phycisphaerales bacterium]|nr:hypothetical protein [Phycisphaerales bacterium]
MIERLSSVTRATTLILDRRSGARRSARVAIKAERTPSGGGLVVTERWTRVRPALPPSIGASWTVTRWSLIEGGCLRVEHLRQGDAHPVALVCLAWSSDARAWMTVTPHRCGRDDYAARLSADRTGSLRLVWSVSGPEKDLLILTRYRAGQG